MIVPVIVGWNLQCQPTVPELGSGTSTVSVVPGAMIHELVAVMAGRVPAATIGGAIHAYPTLSESVKGAFLQLEQG